MKHLPAIILMGAALVALGACKKKEPEKTSNTIIADYKLPEPEKDPKAMDVSAEERYVDWVEGRVYRVAVNKSPNEELPRLTDEIGQEYIDNSAQVTITRADSSVFFNRTFTKADFKSWLDEDYQKNARFEDLRLIEPNELNLEFAATFNKPGAFEDEAVQLLLIVSSLGHINVKPVEENMRDDQRARDVEP